MEQNMGCAVGACLGCVVMGVERHAAAGLPRGPGLRLRRAASGRAPGRDRGSDALDRAAIWAGLLGVVGHRARLPSSTAIAYTGTQGRVVQPAQPLGLGAGRDRRLGAGARVQHRPDRRRLCFVVFMRRARGDAHGPAAVRLRRCSASIAGLGRRARRRLPDEPARPARPGRARRSSTWAGSPSRLASIDFVRRPDPRFPRWLSVVGALTVVVVRRVPRQPATEGS